MTSVFDGIERASVASEGSKQYFAPGNYCVRLEAVLVHKKRLGGNLFVVETTVLESDNPAIQPGEARNWVQPLEADAAMPRIKCFLGAAQGLCPKREIDEINKSITQKTCELAASPINPLKGVVLRLECFNKKSNKTGKDFTIHMWSPTEEVHVQEEK